MPNDHRRRSLPFFALGAALFLLGLNGRPVLILAGAAVWIVGLLLLIPPRR